MEVLGENIKKGVDFKNMSLGDVSELGEIVKCAVCGENAAQLGVPFKGKTVRFIHSFNRFEKGSRKKNLYEEVCVMDGLELKGQREPKKARFKKVKKK